MALTLSIVRAALVVGIEYLVPLTVMIYAYGKRFPGASEETCKCSKRRLPQNVTSKAKENIFVATLLMGIVFAECWTPSAVFLITKTVPSSTREEPLIIITIVCIYKALLRKIKALYKRKRETITKQKRKGKRNQAVATEAMKRDLFGEVF